MRFLSELCPPHCASQLFLRNMPAMRCKLQQHPPRPAASARVLDYLWMVVVVVVVPITQASSSGMAMTHTQWLSSSTAQPPVVRGFISGGVRRKQFGWAVLCRGVAFAVFLVLPLCTTCLPALQVNSARWPRAVLTAVSDGWMDEFKSFVQTLCVPCKARLPTADLHCQI